MKKLFVSFLIIIAISCSACSKTDTMTNVENIPVLRIDLEDEKALAKLYNWDIKENLLVDKNRSLIEFDGNSSYELKPIYWDGNNSMIVRDVELRTDDSIKTIIHPSRTSQYYFKDWTLFADGNNYTLKSDSSEVPEKTFVLPDTYKLSSGETVGMTGVVSGFNVEKQIINILFAPGTESGSITLLLVEINMEDDSFSISEIIDCPTSLSPALPPVLENMIVLEKSFLVRDTSEIFEISINEKKAKSIFNCEELSKELYDSSRTVFLINEFGYFENQLLVGLVMDQYTPKEKNFIYTKVNDEHKIIEAWKYYCLPR